MCVPGLPLWQLGCIGGSGSVSSTTVTEQLSTAGETVVSNFFSFILIGKLIAILVSISLVIWFKNWLVKSFGAWLRKS